MYVCRELIHTHILLVQSFAVKGFLCCTENLIFKVCIYILSYCNVINFVNISIACIILNQIPINCNAIPGQIGQVLSERNYFFHIRSGFLNFKTYSMSNQPKPILKIIVLGDSSVGKTALINRYVNQHFSGNFKATIGTDLASKWILINDQLVTLQVR